MKEYILEILTSLALAGAAAAVAWAIKNRRDQIKAAMIGLIQQAESGIQGSGLGAEKKAWVLAQLELVEGSLPGWVDGAIDELVDLLNEKGAWLTSKAETAAENVLDNLGGAADG